MLQKLGLNPQQTEQRLGDGFYEQQQVLDQITDLTGRRYLTDASDALDQYRDLMNNAVQVAQQFNLSVGVALTPEQMANLTQDIVWLVNVNVDGHQVLEPVVYLSASDAKNLAANGATIKGAQATGNTVLANIGGNLNLASEQDTNDYASHSIQGGITLVYGWSNSGVGVSGNLALSKANSNYASVTQMSGIGAGSGGFDISVGGNTDLKGAVIASTASADKNILDTGSLTYSDIQNHAKSSAESISIGGGVGTGSMSGMSTFSGGIGIPQNSNKSSTTQAGIAQGTIITRDNPGQDLSGLNRNASLSDANGLTNTFDPNEVAQNQQAGVLAGQVGMTAAGDIEQATDLKNGHAGAIALHTLVGGAVTALGGGNALGGALGAGASEAAIPYLQQYGKDGVLAGTTLIGGLVGGGAGASTALPGTEYNYLNHDQVAALNKACQGGSGTAQCQQAVAAAKVLSEKQNASMLAACSSSPFGGECQQDLDIAKVYGLGAYFGYGNFDGTQLAGTGPLMQDDISSSYAAYQQANVLATPILRYGNPPGGRALKA